MLVTTGDIIVYDVRYEPWKTTRVVHNSASVDDSTVDLAWSLDATRLISINQGVGCSSLSFYNLKNMLQKGSIPEDFLVCLACVKNSCEVRMLLQTYNTLMKQKRDAKILFFQYLFNDHLFIL